MHRIFIAINLPDNIKKELISYQEKWPELPIRWTKKENLHITLAFLGSINDEEIVEICKIVKEVTERHNSFQINFKRVCYGPPGKTPYSKTLSLTGRLDKIENRPPRMIWVEGEKSKELGELQKDLENSLFSNSIKNLGKPEAREYAPHLTLGRIKEWEFRKIEPEERPEVDTDISLSFEVSSIEVMESELKRTGPEYVVLESVPLANLH
jgi:2'-5' RNA ligase